MKLKKSLLVIAVMFLAGCVTSPMYHWGDYSSTFYSYKKEPSDKSRGIHKAELQEIISKANRKRKKVPPGIYFELAMMEAEDGSKDLASAHLQKERELFPESDKYVALALRELEI